MLLSRILGEDITASVDTEINISDKRLEIRQVTKKDRRRLKTDVVSVPIADLIDYLKEQGCIT